jgi:hypothetical protein
MSNEKCDCYFVDEVDRVVFSVWTTFSSVTTLTLHVKQSNGFPLEIYGVYIGNITSSKDVTFEKHISFPLNQLTRGP